MWHKCPGWEYPVKAPVHIRDRSAEPNDFGGTGQLSNVYGGFPPLFQQMLGKEDQGGRVSMPDPFVLPRDKHMLAWPTMYVYGRIIRNSCQLKKHSDTAIDGV